MHRLLTTNLCKLVHTEKWFVGCQLAVLIKNTVLIFKPGFHLCCDKNAHTSFRGVWCSFAQSITNALDKASLPSSPFMAFSASCTISGISETAAYM